jgi:hypothetical protein
MARKPNQVQMFAEQTNGVRLSMHEKLCAERMKNILKALEETQKEVKSLRSDVMKGKGALSIFLFLGTMIAGCVGFFQFGD